MEDLSFNHGILNAAISLVVIALNAVLAIVAVGAILSFIGIL